MGRYSRGPGQASQFAAVWDRLSKPEQERILDEVRAALRAVDGEAPDPQRGKPPKHIRFQHGETLVLASARRPSPRSDAAWAALAESGRQIERERRGR